MKLPSNRKSAELCLSVSGERLLSFAASTSRKCRMRSLTSAVLRAQKWSVVFWGRILSGITSVVTKTMWSPRRPLGQQKVLSSIPFNMPYNTTKSYSIISIVICIIHITWQSGRVAHRAASNCLEENSVTFVINSHRSSHRRMVQDYLPWLRVLQCLQGFYPKDPGQYHCHQGSNPSAELTRCKYPLDLRFRK